MAEEKLGTLQYDMLVDQKKLEQQLEDITKKLQEKDKQWKEILSGQGNVVSPKINVADLGNLTKANEAISISTINIKTSIEKLKVELAESVKAYEKLTQAQREDQKVGGVLLQGIQNQKDQLNEYNKILRQSIDARKLAIQQSKEELSAKQALESQRSKAFVKSNLDDEKRITDEIKKQESALRSLEAQRSKAFVRGEVEKEKQITREIKEQQAAIRSLESQRSKAYVATQNKALREEQQALKAAWQEQKLKIAVDNQQAGSIERLRAQYALLKFQLSQVKFSDPNAVASVNKLQTAISGVKNEIQALQPTLGLWGKLTSAIRTYATAYLSVQAVLGLGRAIYGQTKELDSLNFSMKTVIKSSTELAQTQKFLSDVAVNYGGDLLTLSERYIKFRAAAVQSNMSAAETQKIFESVSKAAGTLGLKTDELSGVYLALEQMISKGKVTTEELRRQLGERLPGAFGIMANALGVTIPKLDKLLKKGEVLSTVALPKFAAALEKAYGIESLTKIDTLAAAQGRLSTEFTGLIKGLEASDAFKGAINGLASFIGFIKDNIGVISLFAKAIVIVTTAVTAQKVVMLASVAVQKLSVIFTGQQIASMKQLTAAQLQSAEATWVNVRSWSALSTTFKTLGGWISILVNVLITAAAAFFVFNTKSKETADAMSEINKELANQKAIVNGAKDALNKAKVGTEEYKEALQQLNTIALKYNQTLLTEKSTRDEVNASAKITLGNLDEEYLKKRKIIELDAATTARDVATAKVLEKLQEYYKDTEGGAARATLEYKQFIDQVERGAKSLFELPNTVAKTFGKVTGDAVTALVKYNTEIARIKSSYGEAQAAPKLFDITEIEKAKKAFEEFQKLKSQGAENLFTGGFVETDAQTFDEWLKKQIKSLSTSTAEIEKNKEALTALYIALAEADKKGQPLKDRQAKLLEQRNEAIKRLNDKYLADQEEFANYEMGIQATRIANMEDGLDKEIKLNELAYEKRIAAIEKEKIAALKLLNEARDPKTKKIISLDATGYDAKTQEAIKNAREVEIRDRQIAENDLRESNLKSEKDNLFKIAELRRDANDQFLSGIEKERAAIDEKYDDWLKKAAATNDITLMADVEIGRKIAQSELDKQYAIDQLDFAREIEYKKNEIRLSGAAQSTKLEKANFDVYMKYERERIKILKSSQSIDKQKEGFNKEQELAADKILFDKKQEKELEADILEGAQKISEEYIKIAGLTGESAENLQLAVSTLQNIAKGDYLSAALGVLSKIFTSFSSDNENEMVQYFEQLKVKISEVVDKISTLNSVLSKMGSSASVVGIELLRSEMVKLAADATRLNEQLKEIAASDEGRRKGTTNQGLTNSGRTDATEIESSRKRIVVDLIKQTEYLNQQIILLSNKLLDPNLTEEQRKAIEAVLNGYIEIIDAIDSSIQSITGTSINELSNAIVDAFLSGENAAEAWGNKVNDIIKYMVKQQLISQLLTKPITQAIQTLVTDSEDTLTPEEALKFKNTIKGITEEASPAIAAAVNALKGIGIDISSTSSGTGISKGIQALTEDTGRRLEGLINSIRESGVINIGNTKQLVESSQMIQGYAAQSLGHLRNIDATTAAQLTLFNEIMTSASGTGGKGIKVYVQ